MLSLASRGEAFAIDSRWVTSSEIDLHVLGLARRPLGGHGEDEHILRGLTPGIFEDATLITDVKQVPVRAVRLLFGHGNGDTVCLGIGDQVRARAHVPHSPGGDHADVRLERVIGQLEAHLVVALAGGTVRNRIRAFVSGDLDLPFSDQRSGDRGTEQVPALVKRVSAEHGEDEVADELFAQVFDEDLAGTNFFGFLFDRGEFFALAQVSAKGNHFALVGIDQPAQDHRGIQPAAVSEDDFLDICHSGTLPKKSASTLARTGRHDNGDVIPGRSQSLSKT